MSRSLTTGPVGSHLLALGGPMVLGIFAVLSISLADTYFIGQLGVTPLAAISFTFPVVFTVASLAIGLGAGASSVVSRSIGSSNRRKTKRLATDSLVLAIVLVALFCLAGWFTIEPLFSLLGARDETLSIIIEYMEIWYLGMPFLVIPMVSNSLIRAGGDTLFPSLIMIAAAVINIGLDPVLIFGLYGAPELGVAGAAWATLISRMITAVLSLAVIIFRERLLSFRVESFDEILESWKEVLAIGIPAAAGNMVNPLAIGVVTSIMAVFGTDAVAAFGVATRIEALIAIPLLALSAAVGPLVGQNWGADQRERVLRVMRLGYLFCLVWGAVAACSMWLFAEQIAGLFSDSETVIATTALYLRIVPLSLAGYGIAINAAAVFNALGKPIKGFGYYVVRSLVLYVPLSWLASVLLPQYEALSVFGGIAAANILAGIFIRWRSLKWLEYASQSNCDPEKMCSCSKLGIT